MKILNKTFVSIILFMLGGCTGEKHYIHDRSKYDSDSDSKPQVSNKLGNRHNSGGRKFEKNTDLNRRKHRKIEIYIPFPGKYAKKNFLLAEEYLGKSDEEGFNNNFRYSKDRALEVYIPFPRWYRKKSVFSTEEYIDEKYLEELETGYTHDDIDSSQTHDQQPQVYISTPSKHQKPQSYQTTPSKHHKPQAYISTPSKHQKPQSYQTTPSKHHKPQIYIPTPSKQQKPQGSVLKPSKHRKP